MLQGGISESLRSHQILLPQDLFDDYHRNVRCLSGGFVEGRKPLMKNLKNLSLIGGGALGAVALTLGAAGVAGAQDEGPTLDEPAPVEETVEDDARPERGDRDARRQAIVDQLVEDGVITEEQAESVSEVRTALQEQREAQRAERLGEIADAIGIDVEDLVAAKDAGTPLAEIAGDNLPAVVDVLVDRATDRIEQAVTDGRLTQEQADEKLAGLDERIEARLENGGGFGNKGEGRRGKGHRGHGPRGADAPAETATA